MINDTSRYINDDGSYSCSIIHNTFVCYHHINDIENDVKITIIITEEGSGKENQEGTKEKED